MSRGNMLRMVEWNNGLASHSIVAMTIPMDDEPMKAACAFFQSQLAAFMPRLNFRGKPNRLTSGGLAHIPQAAWVERGEVSGTTLGLSQPQGGVKRSVCSGPHVFGAYG
jgi:hypothetical protein